MYIIYRSKNNDGELIYNSSTIIGIFDTYNEAKIDLIKKITQMKYDKYDIYEENDYLCISCFSKNGKEIIAKGFPTFEIKFKKLGINEIKLK
jgi:hypothetical protein